MQHTVNTCLFFKMYRLIQKCRRWELCFKMLTKTRKKLNWRSRTSQSPIRPKRNRSRSRSPGRSSRGRSRSRSRSRSSRGRPNRRSPSRSRRCRSRSRFRRRNRSRSPSRSGIAENDRLLRNQERLSQSPGLNDKYLKSKNNAKQTEIGNLFAPNPRPMAVSKLPKKMASKRKFVSRNFVVFPHENTTVVPIANECLLMNDLAFRLWKLG